MSQRVQFLLPPPTLPRARNTAWCLYRPRKSYFTALPISELVWEARLCVSFRLLKVGRLRKATTLRTTQSRALGIGRALWSDLLFLAEAKVDLQAESLFPIAPTALCAWGMVWKGNMFGGDVETTYIPISIGEQWRHLYLSH